MTVFEAYITNLGKYAEGQLVGETLKFPATTEEVQSLLKNIGVDGVRYEEFFITAFDGDVMGLYDYDRWAAVHNLKQMAATVAAYGQYGYSPEELDAALVSANADLQDSTAKLKALDAAIREKKELQTQVLAYAKTKPARDGLKAQKTEKARSAYRERHESDFIIADAATRYFRAHGVSKLPSHKALQAEIEQLTAEKNAHYNEYREKKARVKELHTVKSNLSQILQGEKDREKKHEHER